MEGNEFGHVLLAVLVLFVVSSVGFAVSGDYFSVLKVLISAIIIIFVSVFVKMIVAYNLDASVTHRIWHLGRYGVRPGEKFSKEKPFGVYVPLFFAMVGYLISIPIQVMTLLEYETSALKHRAAKRHGFYSYKAMTDWHHGLIGASGIVAVLFISFISYFPGLEVMTKMAAYYALWNMLPFSSLDGTHIYFGSRVTWTVLFVLSLMFAGFSLLVL